MIAQQMLGKDLFQLLSGHITWLGELLSLNSTNCRKGLIRFSMTWHFFSTPESNFGQCQSIVSLSLDIFHSVLVFFF